MKCIYCGKPSQEGAAFCGNCGKRIAEEVLVCPACGCVGEPGLLYCTQCGTRMVNSPSVPPVPTVPEEVRERDGGFNVDMPTKQESPTGIGRELVVMRLMSWYKGEKKVGIAKATGTLTVYTDRLEFKRQLGNAAAALVPIAFVKEAQKARNAAADIFWMRDIADAKEGKYGAALPSLILTLRSGEQHTFAGTLSGDKIRESVELIRRYSKR